jgi:hypothetical protein
MSVPKACYSLTAEAKNVLLERVKELHLPDKYALNVSTRVVIRELKMYGMKSYDCRVFMERLLLIALREFLPQNVWNVLPEISPFLKGSMLT